MQNLSPSSLNSLFQIAHSKRWQAGDRWLLVSLINEFPHYSIAVRYRDRQTDAGDSGLFGFC